MKKSLLALSMGVLLSACGASDESSPEELVAEVKEIVKAQNLKPFTEEQLAHFPKIDAPLADLGKKLFFSKSLSGDMDTACASCHHPFLGGGDDLSLSVGVGAVNPELLGPGRLHDAAAEHHDGGPTVPRNAPTTFNIAFYDKAMFHDGRLENLADEPLNNGQGAPIRTPDSPFNTVDLNAGSNMTAAQARFPVTSPEEMKGFEFAAGKDNATLRDMLAARLREETDELENTTWFDEFVKGLQVSDTTPIKELITYDHIALALGEYQRSQIFVNTPWQRFLEGNDDALSDSQLRGAKLFFNAPSDGGFNCVACHSGSFMTDEAFHVVAIPQIGRGKGNGENGDDDFGRYRETKIDGEKYAFRTPHLLNVTATGPWGHSGAYNDLTDIVRHHLDPEYAISIYDTNDLQFGMQLDNWQNNTQLALEQLQQLQANGTSKLAKLNYNDEQLADVVSFLGALTDPCVENKECVAPWIPSPAEDVDGTLLIAEFESN